MQLLDHSFDRLESWLASSGQPRYRAAQVRRWLFGQRAADFAEMTDLPGDLRARLADDWRIWSTRVVAHRRAEDGTEKLLLELSDGGRIECVLLRDGQRRTICISTQVGCGMGCVFCASGLDGLARNLNRGEIVEQMLRLNRLLDREDRLSHVVVMGMGEPLANLPNLLAALDDATASDGLGVSARRVTISTVGLPGAIRRLADYGRAYHLAVSLHAADDHLRNQLVAANRSTGLQAILDAADYFFHRTGRRPTFEYVLLGGINDRPEHARRLGALLRGRPALVNLIPYNPVAGLPYEVPSAEATSQFVSLLRQQGINIQLRQRRGDAIDAACGQLRRVAADAIAPGR